MTQAVEDLDEYTGTKLNTNDYYYAYYDNLSVIYEQLAKTTENESESYTYYDEVIAYCEDYLTILDIKVEENGEIGYGGSNDNIFNTSYYNKMMKIAYCYEQMGEYDNALAVYKELESVLGTGNVLSGKVYAEHLDYIYTVCESVNQDPAYWSERCPNELADLISVYNEGSNVPSIDSNKTWKKRKDTIASLANGTIKKQDEEPDTNDAVVDENNDTDENEKIGE